MAVLKQTSPSAAPTRPARSPDHRSVRQNQQGGRDAWGRPGQGCFGLIAGPLIDLHVRSTPSGSRSLRQNARTGDAAGCERKDFRV